MARFSMLWFLVLGLVAGCSGTGELMAADAKGAASATIVPPAAGEAMPSLPSSPVPSGLPDRLGIGTYESNVPDYAITVKDVMARYAAPATSPLRPAAAAYASKLEIELVETPGRCADERSGVVHGGQKKITITVERFGATPAAAALTTGTYQIGERGRAASVHAKALLTRSELTPACSIDDVASPFGVDDPGCLDEIEVKSFDGKHVSGTYDLLALDGRYVRGTFEADLCDATLPTTPMICQ